jgi:tRNA nucleotidyltransferase/poly(A) polymerase
MEINLKTPSEVAEAILKFKKNGFEIYIVGGIVRDILLDRPLVDWDFTTNATPEQILAMWPEAFYDNKYGTVGIPTDTRPLEITTFRTEQNYSDGRHPDEVVWGQTLEEDLKRRDFTINAMALKQLSTNRYQLIDDFGGEDDIKSGLIRCVGNANERFGEDALRMMRAVRIGCQLKFAIEDETFAAISDNTEKLKLVSGERIRDELLKIMGSDYPADGYLLLRNTGLSKIILPEMEEAFAIDQKSPGRHHIYDVGTHSVESLKHCPSKDPVTRLATLMHDSGKVKTYKKFPDGRVTFYNHEMESERIAKDVALRLRFSNEQKDKFVRLIRWHQFTVDEHQTDAAIRRFIKNVGLNNIAEMLALRTGDRLGGGARETSWRLEEFKTRILEVQKQPFSIQDLKISGHEIMREKNLTPGPKVGKILEKLFEEVTEKGLVNDTEVLMERLREME